MTKRILLLGEFSGVHTNLSEMLRYDKYQVRLVHGGDGYKSFASADYTLKYERLSSRNRILDFLFKIYTFFLRFIGVCGTIQIFKHIKEIKSWKNYDVVQVINPTFLFGFGTIVHFFVFRYLRRYNKKVFLCALGDDYFYVKFCLAKKAKYSMFDNLSLKTIKYFTALHYVYGFLMPSLNKYIAYKADGVIPGLYDYYQAYKYYQIKCTDIVPIMIECGENILPISDVKSPIKIFHGKQIGRAYHKGDFIFENAIQKLREKYPERFEYIEVSSVPYAKYIELFNDCHIFLDQCYSYDCGVNALLGMKAGKVVFSGFEKEVKEYYKIDHEPLINATPDVGDVFKELEHLLINSEKIKSYSRNSLNFIRNFHSKEYVLEKYNDIWFAK